MYRHVILAGVFSCNAVALCHAQSGPGRWFITTGASALTFRGASIDTTLPGTPGFRPSQRIGFQVALGASAGPWNASVEVGIARGHLELEGTAAAVEDKNTPMHRYRVGAFVGRELVHLGSGVVKVAAGPTFDHWTVETLTARTRIGGEGRLILGVTAGGFELENGVGLEFSRSPWREGELTGATTTRTMKTLSFTTAVRFKL